MDVHVKQAALIGLERGLLAPAERDHALEHLETCPLCRELQAEIQAELAAMDSMDPVPGAVGRHIPPGLLAGFVAARESIGEDLASRIEQHIARCPLCHDAAERAARPRQEPPPDFQRPIPLATFLRLRRGVAVKRDRPRRRSLRGRVWWPVVSGLVLAVIIGGIMIPRWRAERAGATYLKIATPLRLLGNKSGIAPPPAVSLAPGTPLVLFIKLAVPPPGDAHFDLVLRRADGSELKRRIAGTAFDPSGTVAILVAREVLAVGERVEVELVRAGDATRAAVFSDAFTISSPPPDRTP